MVELSRRAEELRHSRERLVDAYDEERRRLERDIHDGAQQHLVALTVNLRLAETIAKSSPERARDVLADQAAATDDAIATLVDLSRGIYPGTLTQAGIGPALAIRSDQQPGPGRGARPHRTGLGCRPRSKRRSTSAAWRRFRTRPSMLTPTRS